MSAFTRTTVIDSSPAGDTVKQAVLDVDTDLTGIVGAYNVHDTATTAVHGVGAGTVCGTTLTQTLTNKTLMSPTISSPTITAGTIQGASTLNALTFAAATTGWTGAGGTASKTLTVDEAVAMSSKAPKASPVFTGDVTLAGKVINATLPAFMARAAAQADVTGDGTAYMPKFTTEIYDQAANFDGQDTFTAPVTGKYAFVLNLQLSQIGAAHTLGTVYLVTSNRTYYGVYANIYAMSSSGDLILSIAFPDADMDAADTASLLVTVTGGTKVVDIAGTTSTFSGRLVF